MEDFDLPPPLEDMSEKLSVIKQMKAKNDPFANSKIEDEEVRLAPKKQTNQDQMQSSIPTQSSTESSSIPMSDDYDNRPKKSQIQYTSQQNSASVQSQPKKQQSGGFFGGMKGGFLNAKPKNTQNQQKPQQPVIKEDLTHIKAKPKEEQLKFQEVQDAMTSTLEKKKDEWMNPEFFQKLSQNPILLKAFTNPQYMAAMSEFGKNPQETMQKYGGNPEFRTILEEFSKMMGQHFEDLGDKKQKEEEEKIQNDPVMQIINNDEQVKTILADPKVKKVLDHLRFNGALDLHEIMRKDPELGMKMQYLIQRGVLNANSSLPV
eukprot:403351390